MFENIGPGRRAVCNWGAAAEADAIGRAAVEADAIGEHAQQSKRLSGRDREQQLIMKAASSS